MLCGTASSGATSILNTIALPASTAPGSRFNAVDSVDIVDISVSSLHIEPDGAPQEPVVTLQTETVAPRTAKVEPSKSGAAPKADPALALPAFSWRTSSLAGIENGYINLDGTTRSNIPTPPALLPARGQLYHVTFYCACMECCGKTNAITASGVKAAAGVTVAAASNIPFGTRIWIEGYGERIVQDRGGAIGMNRLDVYVNTHQEALDHGSRMIMIWFL